MTSCIDEQEFPTLNHRVSVGPMIRWSAALILGVCVSGCDPISSTEIAVDLRASEKPERFVAVRDVLEITSDTATSLGMDEEARRTGVSVTFHGYSEPPSNNPGLWLTVTHDSDPIRVELTEMYIDHPSDKHRQLTAALLEKLTSRGMDARVVQQIPHPNEWIWRRATWTALCVFFILGCWRLFRRRRPKIDQA